MNVRPRLLSYNKKKMAKLDITAVRKKKSILQDSCREFS